MSLSVKRTGADDYGRHTKALICGAPGSGKGLVLDTPILTSAGWVPIGDLSVGDEVIGSHGTPVTVTDIFDRGVLPTYEVTFTDGASVICDGDHLWSLMSRKTRATTENLITKSVDDLHAEGVTVAREGRKPTCKWYAPLVESVQQDKVDLPVEPYLLGVLLANGSLTDDQLTFTTNDLDIFSMVQRCNPELVFVDRTYENSTARRWGIRNGHKLLHLKELGLYKKRSTEKFIPDVYLTAHESARRDLLAALMDCDGCANNGDGKRRRPSYHSSSSRLVDGVIALARSLGGVAWIDDVDERDKNPNYSVSVVTPETPFYLERKQGDFNPPFRALTSIEPHGDAETRCIKVDAEDELFVVKDYLVTHNTLISSTWKNPIYASAEGGLMSVADRNVPYVEIKTSKDLGLLKKQLEQAPDVREKVFGFPVDTVIIDTLDEIQKILIRERLEEQRSDGMKMQDWGWLSEQMKAIVTGFRNMPLHVVFTCHIKDKDDSETGKSWTAPGLQGAIGDEIAAYVDLSLLLRTSTVTEIVDGKAHKKVVRVLQTYPDARHSWIKDRSGKLPDEFMVNFEDDFYRIFNTVYANIENMAATTTLEVETKPVTLDDLDEPTEAAQRPVEGRKAVGRPATARTVSKPVPKPTEASAAKPEPDPGPVEDVPVEEQEKTSSDASTPKNKLPEGVTPVNKGYGTGYYCEECGNEVETEDQASLSRIRFRQILDKTCFTAKKR